MMENMDICQSAGAGSFLERPAANVSGSRCVWGMSR